MGILILRRLPLALVCLMLGECTPQTMADPCTAACERLEGCYLLPSALGAGTNPAQNCKERCALDQTQMPSETMGGADPAETHPPIRQRLLDCTEKQGSGGSATAGEPPTTGGPSEGADWCDGDCATGTCAMLADCLSAAFTNPAARGQASAILLAAVDPLGMGGSPSDDAGCSITTITPDAASIDALCTKLGEPLVSLAGSLQAAEGAKFSGFLRQPCRSILGTRTPLGNIVTGAYAPILDFHLPGGECLRVSGDAQLAKAGHERLFYLSLPLPSEESGTTTLSGSTTCEEQSPSSPSLACGQ